MSQFPLSAEELESQLAATLRRVQPSGAFVSAVRQKMNARPVVQISGTGGKARALLMVLGGTLLASLLILTLARAVFYFLRRAKSA
ncbi:MAG: hypothetical protein OHK0031_16950 [Anaerolineales bacterium]